MEIFRKGSPPYLDTARPGPGTGGNTAFRQTSASTPLPNPPSGGIAITIDARDAPNLVASENLPFGGTGNPIIGTSGSLKFSDYIAAYSLVQPKSYGIYGSVDWEAAYQSSKVVNVWNLSGSTVVSSGVSVTTSGFPKEASTVPVPALIPQGGVNFKGALKGPGIP